MRLIMLFIIAALTQVSAASFGQQLTYTEHNATLKTIFKEIKKQTGYEVIYADKVLDDHRKISVRFDHTPLSKVLDRCLGNLPVAFVIEGNGIIIKEKEKGKASVVAPALIDVSGKIVDEKGLPLPGVNIKVKDGHIAVTSDVQGEFRLKKVNDNAVLVLSFIGYLTKEVNVKPDLDIITLELSNSKLDEVQIQAYGLTSRRLSTSDIFTVKAADIEKQPVNNPLYALQGRVPGVVITPTSGTAGDQVRVQIRGKNSLNQSSEPLYVVDGLPYSNTVSGVSGPLLSNMSAISFLNPSDIESIDILKDADATAIYGSRGANGVIVITTKKGKAGAASVDIRVQNGWARVPKKLDLLNTSQYLAMRKEALTNDGLIGQLSDPNNAPAYPDLLVYDQNASHDWQKELIGGTAHYTDAQGSVSGGSALVKYYIGGKYHKETTVFPGESYDQNGGLHFSITGNSTDQKFTAVLTGSFLSDKKILPNDDLTKYATHLAPNAPTAYNGDGSLNWMPDPVNGFATWINPYTYLQQINKAQISNLVSSAELSYQILPQLRLKTTLGYSELRANGIQAAPSTAIDPKILSLGGDFTRSSHFTYNEVKNFSVEPQLSYTQQFGKGKVDFLLGGALQTNDMSSANILSFGFVNDALLLSQASANVRFTYNSSSQYKYNALFSRSS